jgi:hypothetical protein
MLGWTMDIHQKITELVLQYIPLSTDEKEEIMRGVIEPDLGLIWNADNHFQTPDGCGGAKEQILKEFPKGTCRTLGHILHYIQDVSNPLHTTLEHQDYHISYELKVRGTKLMFQPKADNIFFGAGLEKGIDRVVDNANNKLTTLIFAIQKNDVDTVERVTVQQLQYAMQASFEIIHVWLRANGRVV